MAKISRSHRTTFVWLLAFVVLLKTSLFPIVAAEAQKLVEKPQTAKSNPITEVAKTVSLVTGVALSPLLGTGAVGAWEYIQAPKEKKGSLPWYANPFFWVPALGLVAVVALKDVAGSALPPGFKKPFDVAETIENKVSGLVATGAFVPAAMGIFALLGGGKSASIDPSLSALGFAAVDGAQMVKMLLTPFAMLAFAMVWMAGHAINILILLSPFPPVDAALKALRVFLLSLVTATSFANPYLGAAFAICVILVSYFVAGWAFRLTVFGAIYSWDFVTGKKGSFRPSKEVNWAFTACELEGAPIRTYGTLKKTGDRTYLFEYKPWLVMSARQFQIKNRDLVVGKALLNPEIREKLPGGDDTRSLFTFTPRYRTHEEALAACYGISVEDVGILKGFKVMWGFLKELVGASPSSRTAAV